MEKTLIKLTSAIGKPMHYNEGPIREGLLAVFAVKRLSPDDGVGPTRSLPATWPAQMTDLVMKKSLREAVEVGYSGFEMNGNDSLIVRFPNAKYKFLVEIFGDTAVAVAVNSGHEINKSLRRIIKRAARRLGLKKVDSEPVATEIPQAANDTPPPPPPFGES